MNADQLYEYLQTQQIELWPEGKMLRFRAAENTLSRETVTALRKHKKELLEILERKAPEPACEATLSPASISQLAMYFLHRAAPQSPAYNVASACRICGTVNIPAMQAAFETLISRHEALRTTFQMQDGQLCRQVARQGELDFQRLDVPHDLETELEALVKAAYAEPFDLFQGPLLRVRLFRRSESDSVFLMALHHIVFDAWSLWLLLDEFRQLYAQQTGGETALLPALKASYSDHVRRQEALRTSEHGQKLWAYWRDRLSGELPTLELPTDRPRPLSPSFRGGSHAFRIPPEQTTRLRELARRQRVTPFVLMLAIYNVLLYRYSGRQDQIVGIATSSRTDAELARVVGYFVNALPIRTQLEGNLRFADYLTQVKTHTLAALAHQEFPFPLLVERLNPPRSAGRLPILSVMFDMQKPQQLQEVMQLFEADSRSFDLGGLEVHPFPLNQQEGQFDLSLELFDTSDSFAAVLKYNRDVFEASTAERIAEHFVALARTIVETPEAKLWEYDFLSENEKCQLADFSGQVEEIEPKLAHNAFESQAEQSPERRALVCEGICLSYRVLDRQANQAAHALGQLGVQAGELVACCFDRGPMLAPIFLGILKAGAVFVPLDSANPPERLEALAAGCNARLVIANDEEIGWVGDSGRVITLEEFQARMARQPEHRPLVKSSPRDIAYVIYTSGSTGTPKGVCVSHQAIAAHALAMRPLLGIQPDDRVLQFSSIAFDASLEQMFVPWSIGATVVMRGRELWPPDRLWEMVRREKISIVHFAPAYIRECLDALQANAPALDSLRLLISGGDVFPTEAVEVLRDGPIKILNEYGPTEAVVTATVHDATRHDSAQGPVPIGRPRPGTTTYILDAHDRPCPIGVAGELCLGGPLLAEGYLNDPELTQARFVPDPFQPHPNARMYRTGDRARWRSDGQLEFLGRTDRQIQIQGIRVETGEVESALNSCPAIRASHVEGRTDRHRLASLVAWVVPEAPGQIRMEDLKQFLQRKLPRYMIPQHFVVVEKLPISVSGKINTALLPEPEQNGRAMNQPFQPPRTPVESLLAEIWCEVFQLDSVGVRDNFFDLGGGSLLSLRIVTRAAERGLNIQGEAVPPESVFEHPTIQELADYIERKNQKQEL